MKLKNKLHPNVLKCYSFDLFDCYEFLYKRIENINTEDSFKKCFKDDFEVAVGSIIISNCRH